MADSADQLATVAELEIWMGASFDAEDVARAEFILRVGSGWARQISGKLWPNRDASDFPVTVRGIILGASRREFENPRRVVYEVKGPESATYHNQQYAPGFFSAAEEKFLKRFRPGGGLFSVATYRDDPVFALGYIGMGNGCKPLPYLNPGDPGWEEADHL
ncbi:hypothetical protein FDH96_gp023 [Mycobacterium phage Rey]|uniref:Head-to-tail adaptor n=1 Tax=Mycobacterium phage Rey TaxID=1034115 RepID=G1D585_9CAUD|nr:hypothetical protein FDH96_gp023 [Mycobacterium phage Rey]AEK09935.1 head-to-tail adaptor [Mycobacterium phage Rey]